MDDSRRPAQATPAPPVSMKDTAMRGLQVFAMARQHHDDELAEATREPALSQFDLNNPMYLFGQIGQDEWLDLVRINDGRVYMADFTSCSTNAKLP